MKAKKKMCTAWAIQNIYTDLNDKIYINYLGIFWFDHTFNLTDFLDGQRTGLFRTRKQARTWMKSKCPTGHRNKYSVVKVKVLITPIPSKDRRVKNVPRNG